MFMCTENSLVVILVLVLLSAEIKVKPISLWGEMMIHIVSYMERQV